MTSLFGLGDTFLDGGTGGGFANDSPGVLNDGRCFDWGGTGGG